MGAQLQPVALGLLVAVSALACGSKDPAKTGFTVSVQEDTHHEAPRAPVPGTFGDDLLFLRQHTRIVVLRSDDGVAQIAVAPEYQGRVMTSSAEGEAGTSFGWIHRPVIARQQRQPHMTVLGGEDRFWLGPEGGQFGLYFPPGAPFEFEHWQVPEPIDWGPFDVASEDSRELVFTKSMELVNHSGTRFSLDVRRAVRLLDEATLRTHLSVPSLAGVRVVAYETDNTIQNTGASAWHKDTGLVSIWILGMFTPTPETTVVLPIQQGDAATLGPAVKDDYFGEVPKERLAVRAGHVFFRGDGRERGKIGIPPARALPIAGSYDGTRGVLTLVQFTIPKGAQDYVDSRWQRQPEPYAGDVTNSYNDGPPSPGQPPLGPFYEIESSSPALALSPGESSTHTHRTVHLMGDEAALGAVAVATLGVSLDGIRRAFE